MLRVLSGRAEGAVWPSAETTVREAVDFTVSLGAMLNNTLSLTHVSSRAQRHLPDHAFR
jgi:hypothetical protein